MYNSYIRPLSFDYRDAHEKEMQVEEVPLKFREEPDDYQRRVRPKPIEVESEQEVLIPPPLPPPLPPKPEKQEPCCCCCGNKEDEAEICSSCFAMLCDKCQKSPASIQDCSVCRPQLCGSCKKALKIKPNELNLRSYPIRFKDFATLHFLDCKCQHCHPQ